MFSAGGALMAAGWIEDFALFDASLNLFAARRGRELRKLSNSDLLALVVP